MPFFRNQRQFQQLAFVAVIVVPTAIENTTLSSQVSFNGRFQYQSHTEPAFVPPETITVDKWTYPWSEPVRIKQGLPASGQQSFTSPVFIAEQITQDKWFRPFNEPVRQRIGLATGIQQAFTAPVVTNPIVVPSFSSPVIFRTEFQYQLTAEPPPEARLIANTSSRWYAPWSEPVRVRINPQHSVALAAPSAIWPGALTPAVIPAVSSPVIFPTTFQYQSAALVEFKPVISQDQWYRPWSEPVRQKIGLSTGLQLSTVWPGALTPAVIPTASSPVLFQATLQYQSVAQPAFIPSAETVTVDKWIYAWSEPVRQKPGLRTSLQQAAIGPVLDSETQILNTFESRWHFPWYEPVRIKPQLIAALQQTQIQGPVQTPEFITVDKWIYPWTNPVRLKISLATQLQQAFIAPVLDNETQIIQNFESRWHYAWSEPVRIRPQVPAGEQQVYTAPPTVVFENVTVDKWIYPWTDPVRQQIGLKINLQQAFIAPVLDNETQIIQGFESRWHFPWSEPVRVRPQLPAGEQQVLIQGPVQTPEFITVDKWIYPLTDPVRLKIGLRAQLQQTLIAPVLTDDQITGTIEARWHYPWSEPVRFRRFPTAEQQSQVQGPVQTPEFITVDKWIYGWTDPVRQKIGLRTALQQAFIAPVLTDEQLIGTIESRWHEPWSEPVRFRAFSAAQQQSFAAPATSVFETITVDKWIYPFTDPVRLKLGLRTELQQSFIGLTLNPETQIIQGYESRWHQPWSEPTRRKVSVASQPAVAATPFTAEVVTVDKWFELLASPVRQRIGLSTGLQQAFTAPVIPNPIVVPSYSSSVIFRTEFQYQLTAQPVAPIEIINVDKWTYPWSEPVRQKIGLAVRLQQTVIAPVLNPNTQIIQGYESRWHYPWSEPKRFKAGLGAWLQDTTAPKTPIFPTGIARLSQWFAPLSEPVRLKIGLSTPLQRFFQTSQEVVIPTVFLTLSATEVNSDSAFFGVTAYNAVPVVSRAPTTVVSIKEIRAIRNADTSIEEEKAIDNANVSIKET